MQEPKLFEYAVVRVVPRVEREEFLNVGVIVYCPKQRFLQAIITLNEARLCAVAPALNLAELQQHLHAFNQICNGTAPSSPIAKLDIAARFRWLTATRSTMVQTSRIHPGFCTDAAETLGRLHAQLVLC